MRMGGASASGQGDQNGKEGIGVQPRSSSAADVPQWITLAEAAFLSNRTQERILELVREGKVRARPINRPGGSTTQVFLRARDVLELGPRGPVDRPRVTTAPRVNEPATGSRTRPRLFSPSLAAAALVVTLIGSAVAYSATGSHHVKLDLDGKKSSTASKVCQQRPSKPGCDQSTSSSTGGDPSPSPTQSPSSAPSTSSPSAPTSTVAPSPSPSPSPVPSPSGGASVYGPRQGIACPNGSVSVSAGPGSNIQNAVDSHASGTAFCLGAGTFSVSNPITPKTGDGFYGLYGAVLDGSGIDPTDPNTGIFRAQNQDIDDVTISDLVIRNSPRAGIHAFKDHSDRWLIQYNDISGNRIGIEHGNSFVIQFNDIHDNWQYGMGGYLSSGSVIQDNEIAFNASRFGSFPGDSGATKWVQTTNTTVRRNYVHDNYWAGIWFDGENTGVLIEGNLVVDNAGNGIFHEVSGQAVIRNNTVAGSSQRNIYLSESHDVEVYGNTVRSSQRGIALFQDGTRISESELGNDFVHNNTISVPSGGLGVSLTCINLSDAQCSVYSTSRNNTFGSNSYVVPSLTGQWWYWAQGARTWDGWRSAGQDQAGTLTLG
jgi:parallel beta-helix repeat protein